MMLPCLLFLGLSDLIYTPLVLLYLLLSQGCPQLPRELLFLDFRGSNLLLLLASFLLLLHFSSYCLSLLQPCHNSMLIHIRFLHEISQSKPDCFIARMPNYLQSRPACHIIPPFFLFFQHTLCIFDIIFALFLQPVDLFIYFPFKDGTHFMILRYDHDSRPTQSLFRANLSLVFKFPMQLSAMAIMTPKKEITSSPESKMGLMFANRRLLVPGAAAYNSLGTDSALSNKCSTILFDLSLKAAFKIEMSTAWNQRHPLSYSMELLSTKKELTELAVRPYCFARALTAETVSVLEGSVKAQGLDCPMTYFNPSTENTRA